jgi:small subunit ribosomal protein S14
VIVVLKSRPEVRERLSFCLPVAGFRPSFKASKTRLTSGLVLIVCAGAHLSQFFGKHPILIRFSPLEQQALKKKSEISEGEVPDLNLLSMAKTSTRVRALKTPKFSTRKVNRCFRCGRKRSFMRDFGLCRICFRELANDGKLPGIKKSSW